jgi:two-component system chemotaxis response regulator CheB
MFEMREAGAYTFAQNEETCVVYGMPKEAVRHGAVDREIALSSIADEVVKQANTRVRRDPS